MMGTCRLLTFFLLASDKTSTYDGTKLTSSLSEASQAFLLAGDLTSDMASKLPNWYSSKEGLTGESPAVFGACGMALTQAGLSLVQQGSLRAKLKACASDLASAACALDPIGLNEDMDRACGAMEELAALYDDTASKETFDAQQIAVSQQELSSALRNVGLSLAQYGDLLAGEDRNRGENSAGRVLVRAGEALRHASLILRDTGLQQ